MPEKSKPTLIVLGTGFAAFSMLKTIDMHLYNIIVVSPRNHFLFTPLLPSTTVGTIEFRSIIEPIRIGAPGATYYQASCRSIDLQQCQITIESSIDQRSVNLTYDYLVIGVGATTNTYNIPGVKEHALFLKELADARAIRQRIIQQFEHAAEPTISENERKQMLHFVVVGGGPTGVEFAAEMHDFLNEDLRKSFPHLYNDVNISLLEAGETILNTFDAVLSSYTAKIFQRQNIEVKTHSHVSKIDETAISLDDGTQIPYGMIVWSTGISPHPLIKQLDVPKSPGQRIFTDEFLRIKNYQNVYALGDCATSETMNFPATSQVAQQQGYYLGKQLTRLVEGKASTPFTYHHYGMLAYIGGGKALADLSSFKGKGFTTWLFWRSVYLTKLVSFKNKTLVLFDWFKTLIFGRDISKF